MNEEINDAEFEEINEAPEKPEILGSGLRLLGTADIDRVKQQLESIADFQNLIKQTLVAEQDYGVIPGTAKPSLWKPGAEKILMLLGLSSEYEILEQIKDYERGFVSFTVKSVIKKNGEIVTEGLGASNSLEKKYQEKEWNPTTRQKEFMGKFQDVFTIENTVLKIAKKRAQVDATLTVGSLSNIFANEQDDMSEKSRKAKYGDANSSYSNRSNIKGSSESTIVVPFGPHRGETLAQVKRSDPGHLNYLVANARAPFLREAAVKMIQELEKESSQITQQEAPANVAPAVDPPSEPLHEVRSEIKRDVKPIDPAKTNISEAIKITHEQIQEIELLAKIVSMKENVTVSEILAKYNATGYRHFNKNQAKRFLALLDGLIPKKPIGKENKTGQLDLLDTSYP